MTASTVTPIDEGAWVRVSRDAVTSVEGSPERPAADYLTKKGVHSLTFAEFVAVPEVIGRRQGVLYPKELPQTVKLSQRDLYPVRHAFSPEHITALRLLRLAAGRIQKAIRALNEGDEMAADSEVQRVQVLLPELFCCRALGDGFGSVVNALMSAFESLRGNMPSISQLKALFRVFEFLREQPFLSADDGDQQLEQLEAVELNPYPAEFVEFLSSGESVR